MHFGPKVSVSQVEEKLRELWHLAAEQDASQSADGHPRLRTLLSNVLLVFDEENTQDLQTIVESLSVAHPSRVIVLLLSEEASCYESFVNSRCVLALSGKHVCSEEIYLRAGAERLPAVPNFVLAHAVPEIPLELFFFVDAAKASFGVDLNSARSECLRKLSALSDRVVHDSRRFSGRWSDLCVLCNKNLSSPADNFSKLSCQCCIRDLGWHLGAKWRTLIAEHFDGHHALDPRIAVPVVEFVTGDRPSNDRVHAEALLLAGWIADKLNWRPKQRNANDGQQDCLTLDCLGVDDTDRTFRFVTDESSECGGVSRVTIGIDVDERTYSRVTLSRDSCAGEGKVVVEVCGREGQAELPAASYCDIQARTVNFPQASLDQLTVRELKQGARSRNFAPAFAKARALDALI